VGDTLLRYDMTTRPFPLQASPESGDLNTATLQVIGTNPDPSAPVTLSSVRVTLRVGEGDTDLTAKAPVGPSPPDGWRLATANKGAGLVEYVFVPQEGGAVGKNALVFTFYGIEVNRKPGTTLVTMTEGDGGPTTDLAATKFETDWGTVTFSADPPIVPYDGATTLSWHGPAGTGNERATYRLWYYDYVNLKTVEVPAKGKPPLGPQGQYPAEGEQPLKLEHDPTLFHLQVSQTVGNQTYTADTVVFVTVEPPRPQIDYFTIEVANPQPREGPTFTLRWKVKHADFEITADDGPDGQERRLDIPRSDNSYNVTPSRMRTVYTLTAYREGEQEERMTKTNAEEAGDNPTQQVTAVISQSAAPLGSIVNYTGVIDPAPLGVEGSARWMLCDGRALSAADYPELYALIGTSFGDGSENNQNVSGNAFNLPDLRGRFVRGTDNMGGHAAGRDPDVSTRTAMMKGGKNTGATDNKVGSVQADTVGPHEHVFQGVWGQFESEAGDPPLGYAHGDKPESYHMSNPTYIISPELHRETRPANAYLTFIIRVK
jgi:hypothetical protein